MLIEMVGGAATYLLLNRVELGDADQRLSRGGARGGDLVEAATHVAPAERELDLGGTAKSAVAGIAVDLEHAGADLPPV